MHSHELREMTDGGGSNFTQEIIKSLSLFYFFNIYFEWQNGPNNYWGHCIFDRFDQTFLIQSHDGITTKSGKIWQFVLSKGKIQDGWQMSY